MRDIIGSATARVDADPKNATREIARLIRPPLLRKIIANESTPPPPPLCGHFKRSTSIRGSRRGMISMTIIVKRKSARVPPLLSGIMLEADRVWIRVISVN